MFRKIISILVLFACLVFLYSCPSTRYLTSKELSQEIEIAVLYVTTKDGQQFKLNEPMIAGKIFSGFLEGVTYTEIDTTQIETMAIKKLNKGSTILVSAVGVTAAILFLTSQGTSSNDCNT